MVFWRNKKKQTREEEERKDQRLMHHAGDAEIEPPTEYDSDLTSDQKHEFFDETDMEILDALDETPVPDVKKKN